MKNDGLHSRIKQSALHPFIIYTYMYIPYSPLKSQTYFDKQKQKI